MPRSWSGCVLKFQCVCLLDWAVQNRHLACVKLLLEGIADIDVLAQNGFGRGSVTEAFQSDDPEICTVCFCVHNLQSACALNPID